MLSDRKNAKDKCESSAVTKHKRNFTRMKKAGESIYLLLLYSSLLLSALAISVVMCAQNSELYLNVQERNHVFEGERAENVDDVRRMNRGITNFLSGNADKIAGASDRANRHMKDVKRLLDGTRKAAFALMLLSIGLFLGKRSLKPKEMALISLAPVFLALVCFAFFTFLDFADLFVRFHEIAFSNDLWLLNPEEDLMIRCLPEGFFLDMALIALCLGFALYALMTCFGIFFINKFGRRDFR